MTTETLAGLWAQYISKGEEPLAFSSRDGKLLRLVPRSLRLTRQQMQNNLQACFLTHPYLASAATILLQGPPGGKQGAASRQGRDRGVLAFLRAHAYLQSGHVDQALKDAKFAVAYCSDDHTSRPRHDSSASNNFSCGMSTISGGTLKEGRHSRCAMSAVPLLSLPLALAVCGEVHVVGGNAVQAALCFQQAQETMGSFNSVSPVKGHEGHFLQVFLSQAGGTARPPAAAQTVQPVGSLSIPAASTATAAAVQAHSDLEPSGNAAGAAACVALSCDQEYAGAAAPWANTAAKAATENESATAASPLPTTAATAAAAAASLLSEHIHYQLKHLQPALPAEASTAMVSGGARGLTAWLADEEERRLPEILRSRPKYYYYNKWMRQRINVAAPSLPEPVVQKLLETDATDLDLMLQHPQAVRAQAVEYSHILTLHGPEHLASYAAEPLSWEEVQVLTGPDTVGLPIGYEAPQQQQGAENQAVQESNFDLQCRLTDAHLRLAGSTDVSPVMALVDSAPALHGQAQVFAGERERRGVHVGGDGADAHRGSQLETEQEADGNVGAGQLVLTLPLAGQDAAVARCQMPVTRRSILLRGPAPPRASHVNAS